MDLPGVTWKKSSRSGSQSDCVEVARTGIHGFIRDSKNPVGPILWVDLSLFMPAVKTGHLDR